MAQHSVLVSMYLEREGHGRYNSFWGLLHDAAEAYVGDIRYGLKHLLKDYGPIEDNILQAIITKYGLKWPEPEIVKEWDWIIGANEAFTFTKNGSPKWYGVEPVQKVFISYWESEFAEKVFLARFNLLYKG